MIFNLHPWKYRVRVCPGPLLRDGNPVAALSHGRDILLCGTLKPQERTEALIDQLRRLREKHHGTLAAEGVASFTADVMRQLLAQGGEATLMRLDADGVVVAGAVPEIPAEPIGCECPQCSTRYGHHQIATEKPYFNTNIYGLAVRRSVYCEFCGQTLTWHEATTGAGAPNGRVIQAPAFSPSHVTFPSAS